MILSRLNFENYTVIREVVHNKMQIAVLQGDRHISPDEPAFDRAVRGTRKKRGPRGQYSVRMPSVYVTPGMSEAIKEASPEGYSEWARAAYRKHLT